MVPTKSKCSEGVLLGVITHQISVTPNGEPKTPKNLGSGKFIFIYPVRCRKMLNYMLKLFFKSDQTWWSYRHKTAHGQLKARWTWLHFFVIPDSTKLLVWHGRLKLMLDCTVIIWHETHWSITKMSFQIHEKCTVGHTLSTSQMTVSTGNLLRFCLFAMHFNVIY